MKRNRDHVVIDFRKQPVVVLCQNCGETIPHPLGAVSDVVKEIKAFTTKHAKCPTIAERLVLNAAAVNTPGATGIGSLETKMLKQLRNLCPNDKSGLGTVTLEVNGKSVTLSPESRKSANAELKRRGTGK